MPETFNLNLKSQMSRKVSFFLCFILPLALKIIRSLRVILVSVLFYHSALEPELLHLSNMWHLPFF